MYGIKTTAFLSLIAQNLGRAVGQFVLFVLLLNFLSTAALSAHSLDTKNDFLSGGQSYIICTPQGLKRITLDENGTPAQDDEGRLEHCVYCLPFQKGVISPAFIETDFPVVALISYRPCHIYDVSPAPVPPLNAACPPRAPPLT